MAALPERIVCLTEETCETLYLLGEEDRIVGISGFTVRPPRARKEKPKVSAFQSAKIDRILALKPDLVLGFSDIQADIAAELIRAGVAVHVFNQRSIEGILDMIALLGRLVGAQRRAGALIDTLQAGMDQVVQSASALVTRPRVYFEEWDEPRITAIQWVSELISLAGGQDVFSDRAKAPLARDRILSSDQPILSAQPEIIIGSWCGKRFRPDHVAARPGWSVLPAVRAGNLYEIKSPLILQPGPAALSDGLAALHAIIAQRAARPDPSSG